MRPCSVVHDGTRRVPIDHGERIRELEALVERQRIYIKKLEKDVHEDREDRGDAEDTGPAQQKMADCEKKA
jgi:hypothetical protein